MGVSTPRTAKHYAKTRARTLAAEQDALAESRSSIPEPLIRLVERCQTDPRYFMQGCLSVAPLAGGEVVPFLLNPGQSAVMDVVERQLRENRPIRVIVLKSRRQGISTLGQGLVYWATSTRPHRKGIVVAHKSVNTAAIFETCKLMWDLDMRSKLGVRPQILNSNALALRFDVDRKAKEKGARGLNSSLIVESAEGTGVAVGMTLQAAHLSEVGKWDNPTIMAGLGIALTNAPGTIGIMESTAEGVGNMFHQSWVDAVAGKNEWEPIFLPWTIDPNCSIPLTKAERESWDFQDGTERDLYEKQGVTLEQLKFRRLKIASPDLFRAGVKPEDMFRQEFPTTPDEAFLSSGTKFFLIDRVRDLKSSGRGTKKPLYRATIPLGDVPAQRSSADRSPIHVVPARADYGELEVWEDPIPDEDYVIGADVAQGVEGDSSVAWVLKRSTLQFVARLAANRMDADEFGQRLAILGWRYNEALVGPESNGPGVAAISALRRLRYNRIWFDRNLEKTDMPIQNRMGWRTSPANRRTVLERVEEEIRRATIDMPGEAFFAECETFDIIDGKPQAAIGKHDDDIMAVAITLQLHILGGALRRVKTRQAAFTPKIDPVRPKAQPSTTKKKQIRVLEFF